jgi:cation:H+ antiporter
MTFAMLAAGLGLLVLGGDILVRGAVDLARRLGVSPLLIGLTVVAFGTSMPELVTSLDAAFSGAPGIALGNVIGSNTANILLILGISALISPVTVAPGTFRRDGAALIAATLIGVVVVLWGTLGRGAGAALIAGLVLYVVTAYRLDRVETRPDNDGETPAPRRLAVSLATALGGIAITIVGARLLVSAAIDLAADWGVSDTLVGLTIVAIGTSLPELVTSVMAARKGHADIAFGNVVGSNIFNLLGILGVTAAVRPIPVAAEIAGFDVWVMLAATVALVLAVRSDWRVSRREGAALLAGYAGYTGWLIATA